MKNKIIYTIGYSAYDVTDFISTLKDNGITCLIDVRSIPKSIRYPQYNSERLQVFLQDSNVLYRNYAYEFGARQTETRYYPNGYLDFELFSQSEQFEQGVKRLENGLRQNQVLCLMCAEKIPSECHRSILIGRELSKRGYEVRHLIPHEGYILQRQIDEQLLDYYYPNRMQESIFPENNMSDEEYLRQAYRKRNLEIAFRMEEN